MAGIWVWGWRPAERNATARPRTSAQLVPAPHTLEVDSTLTRLVSDGSIGEVLAVEIHSMQQPRFPDPAEPLHWRQDVTLSGHNIMNMGIWYEAMMRWLGPARRLMALGKVAVARRQGADGKLQDVKVPDHLEIIADLASGALAKPVRPSGSRFSSSGLAPGDGRRRPGTTRAPGCTLGMDDA